MEPPFNFWTVSPPPRWLPTHLQLSPSLTTPSVSRIITIIHLSHSLPRRSSSLLGLETDSCLFPRDLSTFYEHSELCFTPPSTNHTHQKRNALAHTSYTTETKRPALASTGAVLTVNTPSSHTPQRLNDARCHRLNDCHRSHSVFYDEEGHRSAREKIQMPVLQPCIQQE